MQRTGFAVSFELFYRHKETKAKFTNVKAIYVMVVNRIRTVIPSLRHVFSQLNSGNRFKFSILLMGQQLRMIHTQVRVVVRVNIRMTIWIVLCVFLYLLLSLFDSRKWNPFVVTSIEGFKVDIVFVGLITLFLRCLIIYNNIRKKKE